MASTARRHTLLAGFLFFLSGASALVYQVAWQRILALHSGIGLYSVAMIVAAFMAGLGVGSQLGGMLSTRWTRSAALRAFAALELAIGVFGAASPFLYYDWLYPRASGLPSPSWIGGLLHFAVLLPPTALMGMSLPLLVRASVRAAGTAGRTIGYLYGINMLGAAAGAFAGTWLLMPAWGIRGAVTAAAIGNVAVASGAGLLGWFPADEGADSGREAPAHADAPGGRPFALWIGLYALSGFTALSLEIVWFRIIDVAVKSTAFTFGTVLALYLLGNAAGCLTAPCAGRLRRPLWTFLVAQCAILVYSAFAVTLVVRLPSGMIFVRWFVAYWAQYAFFAFGHQWDPQTVARLYLFLPLLLFGVPTVLMGFAFPVLQQAVHDEPRTSGRKVGALQAANIAGCVAGSLAVGLVSLTVLGTAGTLSLLLVGGLVFVAVGLRYYGRRFAIAGGLLLAAFFALPDTDTLWRRLHGLDNRERAFIEEDATGVAAITQERPGPGQWRLSVNGKGNSWLPYGGVHTILGASPALIHPHPREVAIIGLGSGNTVWAAGCRTGTQSITVFELSAPQPRLLRQLVQVANLPDLRRLLEDPRVRTIVADGRHLLESSDARYDVIEADAIWPATAYSGNLYSVEFFTHCARKLKPGGVMCTWAPTPRVEAAFREAFPHVLEMERGGVLIGSDEPLALDPVAWERNLSASAAYLGAHAASDVAVSLRQARLASPGPGRVEANRDLFPRDEFAARSSVANSGPGLAGGR